MNYEEVYCDECWKKDQELIGKLEDTISGLKNDIKELEDEIQKFRESE